MEIDSKLAQSGSAVTIISEGETNQNLLVIKSSKEARFIRQFEKHLNAEQELLMSPVKVPRIKNKLSNGTYSMQYILSANLGEFFLTHKTDKVQKIILSFLTKSIGNMDLSVIAKNKIIDYFDKKLTLNCELGNIKNEKIDSLKLRFSDYLFTNKVPEGWNHGDFSFENILISRDGKSVYTIDFLDSPADTPLIDLGRLYLDLSLGWWNSKLKINESNSQVLSFKEEIEKLVMKNNIDLEVLKLFSLFACVRIMPYTKNPVRMGFLKSYFHEMMRQ
jgi:hypothetical protein